MFYCSFISNVLYSEGTKYSVIYNLILWPVANPATRKSEKLGCADLGRYLNPKHEVSVGINPERFGRLTALSNVQGQYIVIQYLKPTQHQKLKTLVKRFLTFYEATKHIRTIHETS